VWLLASVQQSAPFRFAVPACIAMGPREQRKAIAEQTLQVFASGFYELLDGSEASVGEAIERSVASTVLISADDSIQLAPESEEASSSGSATRSALQTFPVFEVTCETTIEAGLRLHDELKKQSDSTAAAPVEALCLLNFASAKNPGGGFQGGAQAQEESLARASGLFPCLEAQMDGFYAPHRQNPQDGLYSDTMLYSPGVPFFRDDFGVFCPAWHAAVITAPCPNAGVSHCSRQTLLEVQRRRCGRVLRLAKQRGHTELVLGAWGCGVFKNDPEDIAVAFHFWLNQSPEFAGAFRRVVFAIPGGVPANQQPFDRLFGTGEAAAEQPAARQAEGGRGGGGAGGQNGKSERRGRRWKKNQGEVADDGA